ncbi:uncharacterized protein CEXT_2691 [Caerostris extrusa]|uniref:Uncharacterized protein n=1 Tax=Caerostris extrusa TaxID=172846 RepID=A0AAV4P081_CAEEX|nr:uncharacterized protein CEXT_2691 [Caerostris extrusa]
MPITDCPLMEECSFFSRIDRQLPFSQIKRVAAAQPVPRIDPVRATRSPPTAFYDLTHVTCIPKEIRSLRNSLSLSLPSLLFFPQSLLLLAFSHWELRSHFYFLWSPSSGKLSYASFAARWTFTNTLELGKNACVVGVRDIEYETKD